MLGFLKEGEIRLLRERRGWTQSMLAELSMMEESSISRVETLGRSIGDKTFANLMSHMGIPVETLFQPYLNTSSISAYRLKEQILHNLYWGKYYPKALKNAESLIAKLSNMDGFDTGVNRQLILRCLAHIYHLQEKKPSEIIDMTKEGINLTYPEFNSKNFTGNMLMFNEPELIQSQAMAYHKKR